MTAIRLKLALVAFAVCAAGALPTGAQAGTKPPPLRNPALLNIGFVCKWQARCIRRQENAMGHALRYVRKYHPAAWRIQQCNRNAGRNGTRVDWIGFNNCIRNPALRPASRARRR